MNVKQKAKAFEARHSVVGESPPPKKKSREELIGNVSDNNEAPTKPSSAPVPPPRKYKKNGTLRQPGDSSPSTERKENIPAIIPVKPPCEVTTSSTQQIKDAGQKKRPKPPPPPRGSSLGRKSTLCANMQSKAPGKKPRPPVPPKPKNYVPKKFPSPASVNMKSKVTSENQSRKERADSAPVVSSSSSSVDHDSKFFVNLEKGNDTGAVPFEKADIENSSQFFVTLDKQTPGTGSARAEDMESGRQISSPPVTSNIESDEEINSAENNKADSHQVRENGVATTYSRSTFYDFSRELNSGKESPDPLEGLEIEADDYSDDQDEEISHPSHEQGRGNEQLSHSEGDVNGVAAADNLDISVKEQSFDSEGVLTDKAGNSKENVKIMFSLLLEEECSVSRVDDADVRQKLVDVRVNETTDFSQAEEGNESEDISESSNKTVNIVDHELSNETLEQTSFAEPLFSANEDGENVPQFAIEKPTEDSYPSDMDIVSDKLLEDMQESAVEDVLSVDEMHEPTVKENMPQEADSQLDNLELQTIDLINDTSKELMEDKVEENTREVIMADDMISQDTAEVAEDKNRELHTEEEEDELDVKEESISKAATVEANEFENPTEEISNECADNKGNTEEVEFKNVDMELNNDSRDHLVQEPPSESESMVRTENVDLIGDTEGLEQVEIAKTVLASVAVTEGLEQVELAKTVSASVVEATCTVDDAGNAIEGCKNNETAVAPVEMIGVAEPESQANKDGDEPQSPSSPEPVPPERKSRKNRQSKHAYENVTVHVQGGSVQTENKKTDSIPRRTQSFSKYETVVLSLPRPIQRVSDDEAIYRVPSKLVPVHSYADGESVYSVPRAFPARSYDGESEYSVPKPIVVQASAVTDRRKPDEGGEIYAVPGLPTPVPVETFTDHEHLSKEINVVPQESENIYVVPGQQSIVNTKVSAVPPPKPPRTSLCLEPDKSEKIAAEVASTKESPKPIPRARVGGDATPEVNKRKASPSPVPRNGSKTEASESPMPEKRASPSPVPRKGSKTSQTTESETATPPGSNSPVPAPRSRLNALQGNKEAAPLSPEVQSSSEVSMSKSTEDEAPKRRGSPPPRPPPPTVTRISITSSEGTMHPPLLPGMESDSDSDVGEEEEVPKGPPKPKTYYIAHEILSTECTFVDALKLVFEECYGTIKSANVVAESVLSDIFRDLENIYLLDSRFLQELEERMVTWEEHERIGDIIKKYGHFLKMYTQYVNGYDKAMSVFQDTMKENSEFANLVSQFQASERCNGMILSAYMLKPVQRIPSYRLLLIDYLKHLPKDSDEFKDTEAALKIVSEVATHINESMKKMDSFEQLLKLQNMLIGHPEIVKAGRDYLKEGMLMKLCRKDMQERMFFLLTDVLLYTMPMGANQYKLNKMLPLLGMQVTVPDSPDFVNEFSIISTTRSFTLTASTPEERDAWVEALNNAIDVVTKRKITFVAKTGDASGLLEQDGEGGKLGEKAPVWIPDARVTMCMSCTSPFTLTNRRHHCRACGNVVCGSCSDSTAPLVYLNYTEARVCDKCYDKLLKEFHTHEIRVSDEKEEAAATLPPLLQEAETAEKLLRKPTKFEMMRRFKSRKTKRKSQIMHPTHLTEVVANQEGIQMSGYLKFKKGRHGWKKSWFVLKDSVLYSYKASSDVVALDTMPVLSYQIEDLGKEGDDFVFQLKHQGVPPIIFKADNETSAKRWVQELTKATTM